VGLVTWKRESFGHRAQFAVSEFSVEVKNNSISLFQQRHYENPAINSKKRGRITRPPTASHPQPTPQRCVGVTVTG
jgi:hypothetical protein